MRRFWTSQSRKEQSSARRKWVLRASVGTLAVVVVGGAAAVVWLAWPRMSLHPGSGALAQIGSFEAGHVVSAQASFGSKTVSLVDRGGSITPVAALPQGTKLRLVVDIREPWWMSWATGANRVVTATVITPQASLVDPVVVAAPGQPVAARFSRPVRKIEVISGTADPVETLKRPSAKVDLVRSVQAGQVGDLEVSAAPDTWESLRPPVALSYFGSAGSSVPMMLAQPPLAEGAVPVSSSISLSFSQPVASVFDNRMPTITPVLKGAPTPAGHWSEPTPYSLEFVPDGPSFWPGESLTLDLPDPVAPVSTTPSGASSAPADPTTSIPFSGVGGSVLRLQQLLAGLGYLPLDWSAAPGSLAASAASDTEAAQAALMTTSPPGSFAWRWNLPSPLTSLWQPGVDNVITDGAIMTFEQVSHLNTVGISNPLLWPTLIDAYLAHRTDPHEYTWIEVSKNLPETLTFYRNGAVALRSLANTGIAQAPTAAGTYPVYLRLAFQIMRGHNPDGSAYADPVHWINYFNGSDAVHGFVRASYGFPQSVGCVELPVPVAAQLWPMVHIGTLVTVLP